MLHDRILSLKLELKQVAKKDLLKMVFGQSEENCILGGTCPFLLNYQQVRFCVSEVLGHGCQMEKLRASLRMEEEQGKENTRDQSLDLTVGPRLPALD